MARSAEFEPIYGAFRDFLQRCIVQDRSLLWPNESAWTPENTADVKRRLVDAPMFGGDLSFEEKLAQQLQGASRQHWMMVCDIYYVYFLPSAFIKPETKQETIVRIARQNGLAAPADEVWQALQRGFTRTALKYHYKYAQFWLLLLFADHAKRAGDREPLVQDASCMQRVLDELLQGIPKKADRAYDMRHAMLHMAFPDEYECIISTQDKQRIIETYGQQIRGPVPEDMDRAIQEIRRTLSPTYSTPERPFHFYGPELKSGWRSPAEVESSPVRLAEAPQDASGSAPLPSLTATAPTDPDVAAVLSALKRTRNVILYGPPGTGKTYVARHAAQALTADELIRWATFHQSYTYEDFVEGLRPVLGGDGQGSIAYRIEPGVFKTACEQARQDPRHKHVIVIDEINRGNIAKILGELITLIEDDKREGEEGALRVTLPYSKADFCVPGNLYIIGTMNTADRSIALLDIALRRRFAFVELMPRPELLEAVEVKSGEVDVPLRRLLEVLNQGICQYLDRDHQIGHSYFLKVARSAEAEQPEVLEFVWNEQVMPLLEEYFYSQRDKLADLLAPCRTELEQDGAHQALRNGEDWDPHRYSGSDLLFALDKLAGSSGRGEGNG